MIQISISGESRPLNKANKNWIKSRVNEMIQTGKPVTVHVVIDDGPLDIILSSGQTQIEGGEYVIA